MRALRSFLLAGLFASALTAGAGTAHAARINVAIGFGAPAPVVRVGYMPPCPGPDYYWSAGYYAGPVWYPGRWTYRGPVGHDYGWREHAYVEHRDFDHRDFEHRDFDRDHGFRGHNGYRR